MTETLFNNPASDDLVTVFQLDGKPVRGRAVRMGASLTQALGTRYPDLVARLLGEAMLISAIVAQSLKFDGRLVIQCHGTNEGAVSLLMSDCTTEGHVRGYARWDADKLKEISLDSRNPGADTLLGGGTFSMTIDQGPDMDQYQGLAAIEGARLSECAEHYFKQSEQIPTEIRLVCGELQEPGKDPVWRGGGLMIQKIAEDKLRGDTDEAWDTARALFQTVSDAELLDPDLTQNELLYRLFHEDGVRVVETSEIEAKCKCSRERLENTLRSFEKAALEDMAEDGVIDANCEFCDTTYSFPMAEL
ncbi:Hsp33 family molecular chaperone HslO [Hellea balneolensis]|uniref:Hsp33 family molecular chaperone HslO n=1 Tax=Hellea balneolensis TaxID=287478 RepID=UPI00047D6AFF|nr:Hsp33 family molecular chaperone HslO [Hellea balneolensis]